jgi:hypothetical protein
MEKGKKIKKAAFSKVLKKKNKADPKFMDPTGYDTYYDCGCGGQHMLSGGDYQYLMCAKGGFLGGFKFLLRCENEYVTLVKAKGMFPTKITEDWTCKAALFEKVVDDA